MLSHRHLMKLSRVSYTFYIQKLYISGRCFQDCVIQAKWQKIGQYHVVLMTLLERNGKEAFDEPMLLITNKQLVNQYDVYNVYNCYLKRSGIEGVFKFIKGELGWEEFRLKDFEGIKGITAIGFFMASYLYEIGQGEVYDDFVVLIAQLGGSKSGEVTRHYILEGMKTFLAKLRVDQFIEEHQISKKRLKSHIKFYWARGKLKMGSFQNILNYSRIQLLRLIVTFLKYYLP